MEFQFEFEINPIELLKKLLGVSEITTEQLDDREFEENGRARFISMMTGDRTICAFFHSSRWHTATAESGYFLSWKKSNSRAAPGKWAITWVSQQKHGNKTHYHIE